MIRCSNDSLSQTIDKMSFNLKRQYNIKNSSLEINPIFLYFIHSQSQQQQQQQNRNDYRRQSSSSSTTASIHTNSVYDADNIPCCGGSHNKSSSSSSKSIWNHLKRIHRIDLKRELKYLQQDDHLFPYYLIASLIITIMIILIRFLTLYDYNYYSNDEWKKFFWSESGNWFCYIAIIVAIIALIYTLTNKHNHDQQRQRRQRQRQRQNKSHNTMIGIEFRMAIWLLIPSLLIVSTIMDMSHCSMAQMQEMKILEHNRDNRTMTTIGKECLYKWVCLVFRFFFIVVN